MESPVDAHLTGVGGCIGVTGAIVGIGVSWRVGLDVDEGFLEARRGDGVGVNVLGVNVGNDVLEHLGSSLFLSPPPRGDWM